MDEKIVVSLHNPLSIKIKQLYSNGACELQVLAMPAIDTLVINAKDPTENRRKKNRKENAKERQDERKKQHIKVNKGRKKQTKKGTEKEGSKNQREMLKDEKIKQKRKSEWLEYARLK